MTPCAIVVTLALAIAVFARIRHQSHITYLKHRIAQAQHGGDAMWDYRCQGCKRRLRDSATTAHTDVVRTPGGGTRTTTMAFHSGRRKCAAAAGRYANDQHQEQQ